MAKEIEVVQRDLNQQVDIIHEVVTKFVNLYEALTPQLSELSTTESVSFAEINNQFKKLKSLISKYSSSPLITPEFLSNKFTQYEDIIHKQLAPLSRISSLLPTDAPPVVTRVQGGERKVGFGREQERGERREVFELICMKT
ncbi:unnamed protein product [Lactuca saligna]|uniref:Uncharacterized protein n=1 Tax=Lactuca saligna TaxID=75948 RepID=A0AA35Z607_LACSI|nr:unnamed protein product [Lactuca saligna]